MKKTLCVLVIFFVLVCMLGCAANPAVPITSTIYYTVTGGITSAGISYYVPGGFITNTGATSCPYTSSTYTFTKGDTVGIAVIPLAHTGSFTVNIYKNGSVWKTTSVSSMVQFYSTLD